MIRALLTGTLHADPESRTSKTGKPYCTARLKADSGDNNTVWCSLIAFGQEGERLIQTMLACGGRDPRIAWKYGGNRE